MTAGLAIIVIVAAGWSVFGYIPTKVVGQGTLTTSEEEAHVIEASAPGMVTKLLVSHDDHVSENQTIAILEQPELVAQERVGRNRLAELEANLATVRLQAAQELTSRETVMAALTKTLTFQAEEAQKRTERLTGLLDMMNDLAARGMARKLEVEKIRQDRDMAITEGSRAQSQLNQEQSAFIEFKGNLNVRITNAERLVQDQRHQLDQLEAKAEASSSVRSPVAGIVTEMRVGKGSVVLAGEPLAVIADENAGFDLLAFIEPRQGKKIEVGMDAEVVPGTIKKEEYGAIRGQVVSVSVRPVSEEGINSAINNPTLSKMFTKDGSPIVVRVRLVQDPNTESGFAWWSGTGPPFKLAIGTLCTVEVVVRKQPPITLVVPYLKRFFGL